MFGVPIIDSTKILCNNKSGVKDYSILASTLNKKYISIAYHSVRCNVAANIVIVEWIDTN